LVYAQFRVLICIWCMASPAVFFVSGICPVQIPDSYLVYTVSFVYFSLIIHS
jgi:hypothetical protein